MSSGKGAARVVYVLVILYTLWIIAEYVGVLKPLTENALPFGKDSLNLYTALVYLLAIIYFLSSGKTPAPLVAKSVFKQIEKGETKYSKVIEYTTNTVPGFYSTTNIMINDNIFLKLRIPIVAVCADCSYKCLPENSFIILPDCDMEKHIPVSKNKEIYHIKRHEFLGVTEEAVAE